MFCEFIEMKKNVLSEIQIMLFKVLLKNNFQLIKYAHEIRDCLAQDSLESKIYFKWKNDWIFSPA